MESEHEWSEKRTFEACKRMWDYTVEEMQDHHVVDECGYGWTSTEHMYDSTIGSLFNHYCIWFIELCWFVCLVELLRSKYTTDGWYARIKFMEASPRNFKKYGRLEDVRKKNRYTPRAQETRKTADNLNRLADGAQKIKQETEKRKLNMVHRRYKRA